MNKKLIYIANVRLPTEKAHGFAIMKMCEAFSQSGVETKLLVPWRRNKIHDDPYKYYGVKNIFTITKLPSVDLIGLLGKVGFLVQEASFALITLFYSLWSDVEVIYGRDDISLSLISIFKQNVVWEAHTAKRGVLIRLLLRRSNKVITISQGLKDHFISLGADESKIHVLPSGVDLTQFDIKETKEELRKKLSLPLDRKIVAYVGKSTTMGKSKGVEELREAFPMVQTTYTQADLLVVTDAPPYDLPLYMRAADVLIMNYPNTGHYAKYMSPLKLFEYMASGRPIIAPRLPSILEIVDDETAFLFSPEDQKDLIKSISLALSNLDEAEKKASKALTKVAEYSWDKRAQKIITFIRT